MGIPFNELTERIDTEELAMYEAAEIEYPSFPDDWLQTALICTVTSNSAFGSKGRAKIEDFLPTKKRKKTQAELITIAQILAARAKANKGE